KLDLAPIHWCSNAGRAFLDSAYGSVSFARYALACRLGSRGLRAGVPGALLQRRLEPVADLLDRGAGGVGGRDRLGMAASAVAALGLRVLLCFGCVRGVAGRVDRVVDPAEPFVGLHEP